jgi:hypothetical protein
LKSSVDKLKENKLLEFVNGKAATATFCAALIVFVNLLSSPAFAAVGEGSVFHSNSLLFKDNSDYHFYRGSSCWRFGFQ